MAALRSVPNHGGSLRNRWMPKALKIATRQFVPNATRDCAAGIGSAITCAGTAAAMYSHQWLFGTRASVHTRMMLVGKNGAKIRSDEVQMAHAACTPR